ncbi:hypothetical protein ACRE_044680 [Hapsidospora chrysogenum ATCC 11550]|uniref:Uncharacterized protein n=1 Tax=Hapsidospora chrysogenum (strain ATCC 11550 / CBS 779.69 / DSM 880 / IAM 14645 / JCM 23072 / IMI 49137) TaxID=857340 RepID=A0A086T5X2_HAPC1|nr:hypothetical protein ACRE_044680 [Hapsidospora chrysogenum ATCC 11550]
MESLNSSTILVNMKQDGQRRNDGSSGGTRSGDSEAWEFVDMIPSMYLYREGNGRDSKPAVAQPERGNPSSHTGFRETSQAPAYWRLLAQKELPDAWPLRLLQVCPASTARNSNNDFAKNLIDIRRFSTDFRGRTAFSPKEAKDEQSEQFTAAINSVDKTPKRVKLQTQQVIHSQQKNSPQPVAPATGSGREECPGKNTLGDPDRDQRNMSRRSVNSFAHEETQPRRDKQDKEKWQKLLDRLHRRRNNLTRTSDAIQEYLEWPTTANHQRPGEAGNCNEVPKDANRLSADSGYSSTPGKSGTERSDPSSKATGSFNPRAREFLSFAGDDQKSRDGVSCPKFRPVPIEELFSKAAATAKTKPPGADPVPPHEPLPMTWAQASPPFKLPPGTVAPCNTPNPYLGVGPFPGPWAYTPATWSPGSLPNIGFPNPVPTPFPTATPIAGGENWAPGFPSSLTGTAPLLRPRPVPKPRKPDPKSQQEYEAWIEWRKANEPGYALECKLRQQRRSQRNATGKMKSAEAPKRANAEVAVAP